VRDIGRLALLRQRGFLHLLTDASRVGSIPRNRALLNQFRMAPRVSRLKRSTVCLLRFPAWFTDLFIAAIMLPVASHGPVLSDNGYRDRGSVFSPVFMMFMTEPAH
jgi:DNA primase